MRRTRNGTLRWHRAGCAALLIGLACLASCGDGGKKKGGTTSTTTTTSSTSSTATTATSSSVTSTTVPSTTTSSTTTTTAGPSTSTTTTTTASTTTTTVAEVCGDGVISGSEGCDPGPNQNRADDIGCDPDELCATTADEQIDPLVIACECETSVCGDGVVQPLDEDCDTGKPSPDQDCAPGETCDECECF